MSDPELVRILTSALELQDQGIEPPIESLCGERPDLIAPVREALGMSGILPDMHRLSVRKDRWTGRLLADRYELCERLGSGAMGVVYAARDRELGRRVAVKMLRSEMIAADEAELRFEREGEVLAAVQHPAVVQVYDRGSTEDGALYLVMEHLEGCSLSELLEDGQSREAQGLPEGTDWIAERLGAAAPKDPSYVRTAARWAADLAGGLAAAHAAGVYHRDVKPSNILVRVDEAPVLLDFGIAARSSHATFLREGSALGTPAYMAPEALNEDHVVGPALDVYGLTATLYHMLILRAPYAGSPSQIISSLVRRDPEPAYRQRPGLPRDLQAILDRGMARNPAERYSDAAALERDLRAFLDFRPVSARPLTSVGRTWRRLRRSPAFFVAVGLLSLVLAVWSGSVWRAWRLEARRVEHLDVIEHLPAALTVGAPANRRYSNEVERTELGRLLDRAVDTRVAGLPTLLLRASFRLDHGEPAGALADMELLERELGTEYAARLVDRYRALPSTASGSADLVLTDLPEPVEPEDLYLAGFHKLRAGEYYEALRHFEHESLASFAPAQELLIPLVELRNRELSPSARSQQSLRNYERAVRLEAQIGRRTATTAHLLGSALVGQHRYADALEPLRDGVQLSPWAYGLHLNLGIAARRLAQAEEAEMHLLHAIELRPKQLDPHKTLARLFIFSGELDRAQQIVSAAPFSASRRDQRLRLSLEGDIEMTRALLRLDAGDEQAASEAAERSVQKYTEAVRFGGAETSPERRISAAIVAGDLNSVFAPIAEMLTEDPLRWRRIGTLLHWVPKRLSVDQTAALKAYLTALRDALAQRES